VDHLPDGFESSKDFADARFECWEGSMVSLPAAIHFLDDVLDNLTGTVLCFIDGLKLLIYKQDKAARSALREVIWTLCFKRARKDLVTKVRFTTDGYVDVLARAARERLLQRTTYQAEDPDGVTSEGSE
jgi:hypothetical protein